MKGTYTIINEMVANSADVMEAKIVYLECVAVQYEAKGETVIAQMWRQDIPDIKKAIEVMRKLAGCWA